MLKFFVSRGFYDFSVSSGNLVGFSFFFFAAPFEDAGDIYDEGLRGTERKMPVAPLE